MVSMEEGAARRSPSHNGSSYIREFDPEGEFDYSQILKRPKNLP